MDDLISELHEWTQDLDIQDCGADGVLFRAIDRIEQLEAALREINKRLNDNDSWLAQSIDCRNFAEAALGEKLMPTKTPLMELIEKKMNDGEPPVDWSK
jgi:hypothetical protein